MDLLLARNKPPSIRRQRSNSSVTTTSQSDQKQREEKSAPYRNSNYITLLEYQGNSYMREYELGIRDEDECLCQEYLDKEQPIPENTIFRDDIFRTTCNHLVGKNEARIFKDIFPLIVPFAESLALLGANNLENVVESVNEGWNNCISVTKPRPQPDYALGFGRNTFSDDQLDKLQPYIGDPLELSYFRATHYMYFPFLTAEVKCGAMGLEIADRQNAHSMTVAMNGIVQLFKRVGREKELHRRVLGFTYSHDDESVRIWAHYPVVSKSKTTFWRHSVIKYYFTGRNGAERWAANTFTRNIYDLWVKGHLKLIRSAINNLCLEPDITPQPPESEDTGLSQQFAGQELEPEMDSQPRQVDLQQATPDTSAQLEKPAPRKKKKKVR